MPLLSARGTPLAKVDCHLEVECMIRITPMQEDATVVRLRVEGRVTQQAVEELSGECEALFANHHPLLLELSGVQFVDPAGIAVFHRLIQKGAVLTGCSGFLTELLRVNATDEGGTSEPTRSDG